MRKFYAKSWSLIPSCQSIIGTGEKLALCTASLVKSVDIPDYKQLERLFWDNVNHTYGTGYFAEILSGVPTSLSHYRYGKVCYSLMHCSIKI